MLTLEDVCVIRDDFALRADLDVPAGAHVAVMGPSGAGKSTLIEAIGGFVDVAGGRILWADRDITRTPPDRRPVATIFQDNNLFPHMSAAQNVALGLTLRRHPTAADRRRVAAILERVGLADLGPRKPAALSGGQRSRVALARAALQDRPLLLLDEPFAALGPALKAEMIGLVAELAADDGRTVLMITHDPEDARTLGGDILLVADGRAQAPRDADLILSEPPPALARYLGK